MSTTVKAGAVERRGPWRKSSRSNGMNGNCVEVAPTADGGAAVRHSENPDGEALVYTRDEWTAFLSGVKDGEFDFVA